MHVGAKDGYYIYGNCILTQQVMARRGTVANAGIVDLVKIIKCAKMKYYVFFLLKMPQELCHS
jgi:hypothetical protein